MSKKMKIFLKLLNIQNVAIYHKNDYPISYLLVSLYNLYVFGRVLEILDLMYSITLHYSKFREKLFILKVWLPSLSKSLAA